MSIKITKDKEHVVRGDLQELGVETVVKGFMLRWRRVKGGGVDTDDSETDFGGDKTC